MDLKMILLDSSFLVAVEVENDQNHEKAKNMIGEIISGMYGPIIISDYIFDETVTVTFLKTKNLKKAIFVGENLKLSTKILKIDESLFWAAWNIFKEQKNTKLSFTDCTNISLLDSRKIKNIATFDKDFKLIKGLNIVS